MLDVLLKKINLDFRFTTYKCIACSPDDGMMELVKDSSTIQKVQLEHKRDISVYLQWSAKENNLNIDEVMENYLQSSAGYAAVTYLMAIGDRHLENLMITKDGHFFHLDFGFILGKQPPNKDIGLQPFRINEPMVKGMGGKGSDGYKIFK